jgi:hypothetical protein
MMSFFMAICPELGVKVERNDRCDHGLVSGNDGAVLNQSVFNAYRMVIA